MHEQHCLWTEIAPLLLEHPAGWHPRRHLECCGQSCGCCRSHNIEDAHEGGNCQPCFTGWVLSCVSRSARVGLRAYSRRLAVIANCQLRKYFGAMVLPYWGFFVKRYLTMYYSHERTLAMQHLTVKRVALSMGVADGYRLRAADSEERRNR